MRGRGSKAQWAEMPAEIMAVVFAIPGDITLPTGGYAYDREVLARLPAAGVDVAHLALPGGYPEPSSEDLARTAEQIAATPPGAVLLIDGLAYGAMPAELIARFDRPIVALVHHPLCLEAGVAPAPIPAISPTCVNRTISCCSCDSSDVGVHAARSRSVLARRLR